MTNCLTQTELSKLSGIHQSAICGYEKGVRSNITVKNLVMLADALNTSTDYLLGRDDIDLTIGTCARQLNKLGDDERDLVMRIVRRLNDPITS